MRKKISSGVYEIETNMPLERKRINYSRFPFDKMKKGDSFFIPASDQDPIRASSSVYSAARSFNNSHGTKIKVSVRRDEKGTRVWRIE